MALNTNKPQNLTQQEVQEWEDKDKHKRKLSHFKFEKDDGGIAEFWVCPPSRQKKAAIAEIAQKDSLKASDLLINTCVIAGDVDVLVYDDAMYDGLGMELTELIKVKKRL